MTNYETYKSNTLCKLSAKIREKGKNIPLGQWQGKTKNDEYRHILPLLGRNTREHRIHALQKYLNVRINKNLSDNEKESLHPYIHHVNSSQLLCYMVFSKMLNNNHTPKDSLIQLFEKLGIAISQQAKCFFEYCDDWCWKEEGNEPEGTSFDFHISDKGKEYFFEIKFTEQGFGKATKDKRHDKKITELYLPKCKYLTNQPTTEEFCRFYQLFRNLLRADKKGKTVIFITDGNNPATNNDLKNFEKYSSSLNVKHITWQEICKNWPKGITKPFQFVCFE